VIIRSPRHEQRATSTNTSSYLHQTENDWYEPTINLLINSRCVRTEDIKRHCDMVDVKYHHAIGDTNAGKRMDAQYIFTISRYVYGPVFVASLLSYWPVKCLGLAWPVFSSSPGH